ncbi:unnamed protein product [Parajaminaea phylloscopi]
MRWHTLTAPLALALLASLAAANVVVDLTNTDRFDQSVGLDRPALVKFFAPWCGHCRKLEPIYEEVAASFKSQPGKVLIGKVDADANKALGKRFGISGYPTLKWFPFNSTTPEEYKGPRDLDSIVAFINEKTGAKGKPKQPPPPAAKQLTATNFKDIVLDATKNALVEFYAPWCGHCKTLAPVYESVAKVFDNDDDCVVAQMDADNADHRHIAEQYGVQSYPTIKFFPKGSTEPEAYQGGRSEAAFIDFLNSKCGLQRIAGGGLSELAGRIPSLDSLAAKFYAATGTDERKSILETAKEYVGTNGAADTGDYYLRVMNKLNVDPKYVTAESKRLKKILDKHVQGTSQLAARKVDEIKRKSNVLAAFGLKQVAEAARNVKESAERIRDEL